ncbi:phospholipase C/P1 nuclease [Gonapodya prolifera JEL478]|uniref:Phospholipase C/P1 nuclease n=1 Tax=Gonapodya prolifera (strain JEL478) TaxID=1344416 RepID=A0A139AHD6_GONPJ|nr:phospholipase C/P1 nuclease [Gonapodya prolifera JEL478]|eukprot:KXS15823.1 phospholipase C/P1 nuclease [Gonapodya prolifera JEL478]
MCHQLYCLCIPPRFHLKPRANIHVSSMWRFALIVTLASAAVPTVFAWGDGLAHPVIGELAQTLLSAKGRQLVESLVDPKYEGSLGGQTCNWADYWRFNHRNTGPWHFVDMNATPPSKCGYSPEDCADGNCIIGALTAQTYQLLNTKCEKSINNTHALQFIAHFIGDVTQPLHTVGRDIGGNSDHVKFDGRTTNFHAIHDAHIPDKRAEEVGAGKDARAYAGFLANLYGSKAEIYASRKYVDLVAMDTYGNLKAAINMAVDSNVLDCSSTGFWNLYDEDPAQDFGKTYYEVVKLPLEEQIAKLAAWINAIADQCLNDYSSTANASPQSPAVPIIVPQNRQVDWATPSARNWKLRRALAPN